MTETAPPRLTLRQRWHRLRTSPRFPFVVFLMLLGIGGLTQVYCYWWGVQIQRVVREHQGDMETIAMFPDFVKQTFGSWVEPLEPIRSVVLRPKDQTDGNRNYVGQLTRDDLRVFRNCAFLRDLALVGVRPPEVSRELEYFTQLNELCLHHASEADAEAFSKLPRVEKLSLAYTDSKVIPYLPKMKNLRSLSLMYYFGPVESFSQLARSESLRELWVDIADDSQLLALTEPLPDGSPPLRNLHKLELWGDDFTALGMTNFRHLPRLEKLNFAFCDITDCELTLLADLPQLKSLYIGSCEELTDVTVGQLASLRNLQTLNVTETDLSEEGVLRLAQMPRLRSFRIDRQWRGIEDKLRQRLPPGCQLLFF